MSTPRGRDPNSRKATRGGRGNIAPASKQATQSVQPAANAQSSKAAAPPRPTIAATAKATASSKQAKIGRLIIAIDLGTTRLAVATKQILYDSNTQLPQDGALTKSDPLKLLCHWPASAQTGDYRFPPTSIYYPSERKYVTGNELTNWMEDPKFNPELFFRQIKMMFHHTTNEIALAMQARIRQQLKKLNKDPEDALRDLAKGTLDHLFEEEVKGQGSVLANIYDRLDQLDIELVLTVPPGRSTVDHAKVRHAFLYEKFDTLLLNTDGSKKFEYRRYLEKWIKPASIFVESEPAAMFRHWVHEGSLTQDWALGKSFVVADIGGGTCCIVRLRLESLEPTLQFKQEYTSSSIPVGAETITDAFKKTAGDKVPANWPKRLSEITKLTHLFERSRKLGFGHSPFLGMEMAKTGVRDQFWKFTFEDLEKCFRVCLDALLAGLDLEVNRGQVDYIVLGGGLADNKYISSHIKQHFIDKNIKIRELGTGKEHVVKGAILGRENGEFIADYPITRSKAITLWIPVDDVKDLPFFGRLSQEPDPNDKTAMYVLGADWIVKKGRPGGVHVASSEDFINEARFRHLDPENKTPLFDETVLTFDYVPGEDDQRVYEVDGDEDLWVNEHGLPIPAPEHEEKLTWQPWTKDGPSPGFTFDQLDNFGADQHGNDHKVLRYSIEMKVTETATLTCAKIWASRAMLAQGSEEIAFRSKPIEEEPNFHEEFISKQLAEGYNATVPSPIKQEVTKEVTKAPRLLARGMSTPRSNKQQRSKRLAEEEQEFTPERQLGPSGKRNKYNRMASTPSKPRSSLMRNWDDDEDDDEDIAA